MFGSASTIWYPASGFRYYYDGSLIYVGGSGRYWSASPSSNHAYLLYLDDYDSVNPSNDSRAFCGPVILSKVRSSLIR